MVAEGAFRREASDSRGSQVRSLLLGLLLRLGPTSAEGIQRALAGRGLEVALSSVYLTLNALERSGALRSFRGLGRTTLFVHRGRAQVYLICRSCGRTEALPLPEAYVRALERQSERCG